jgi:hypothetical protein
MRHISLRLRLLSILIVLGLVFQFVGPAEAVSLVIDTSLNEQDKVVRGEFAQGTFGEVSIMGDFNNDGYDDLLIGAPAANAFDMQFAGAAYVILGGPVRPSEINLALTQANLSVYGTNPGDILGHSVAVGDVNGDGIDDIIIGADRVDHAEMENVGAVYIFLGREDGAFFNQNVRQSYQADVIIYGEYEDGRFGRAVSSGDVTGNGIDDVLIGTYFASPDEDRTRAGALYVIQGSSDWTAGQQTTIDLMTEQEAHLTIFGEYGGDESITTLSTRDAKSIHPLLEEEFYILQSGIGDRLGRTVATGNVNGTGPTDIIVGAYGADVDGRQDAGKTYVFYGSTDYQSPGNVIDLAQDEADVTIYGVAALDQAGFYVAAGDIMDNGFADIMIGAYRANNQTGQVYLVYGRADMPSQIFLENQANVTINGAAAGDRLGRSTAFADINGDGRDDLLIGASRANPNGRIGAGMAYVIFTDETLPGTIHLSQEGSANIRILGAASGDETCVADIEEGILDGNCPDELGRAIAAGDFNRDGKVEIVVGALFSNNALNGETRYNAGAVYIISGARVQDTVLYLPLINRN